MSIKKKKYNLQRMNAQSVIAHCCLRSFGPIARGFVGWRYIYITSAYIVLHVSIFVQIHGVYLTV